MNAKSESKKESLLARIGLTFVSTASLGRIKGSNKDPVGREIDLRRQLHRISSFVPLIGEAKSKNFVVTTQCMTKSAYQKPKHLKGANAAIKWKKFQGSCRSIEALEMEAVNKPLPRLKTVTSESCVQS